MVKIWYILQLKKVIIVGYFKRVKGSDKNKKENELLIFI